MVLGNLLAILKRNKDKKIAQESLKTSPRTSKQTNSAMLKNQVSQGKATLAIAPLKRSIVFIVIGLIAFTWAILHHAFGGIRHLIWDLSIAHTYPWREYLTRATLVASLLCASLFWIALFWTGGRPS